jgi:hypothetical protein
VVKREGRPDKMLEAHWAGLAYFVLGILMLALYGLTAGGHFPAEARSGRLRGAAGTLILWVTLLASLGAAAALLLAAWAILPWHIAVIGGGAALLFAPLILRPFPDSFVDGRAALLAFSTGALLGALLLWTA